MTDRPNEHGPAAGCVAPVPAPAETVSFPWEPSSGSLLSSSGAPSPATGPAPLYTDPRRVLTTSRFRTYRRCPREHRFAYELGVRPIEDNENLRLGTLVHKALEAWWKETGDRLVAALAVFDAARESDPFEVAKARAMLMGYHARWADEPLEVLAVEVEIPLAPLVNPSTGAFSKTWLLGGKLDVVARDVEGRDWIVEHKTTSDDASPGSEYVQNLRIDGQVSTYYEGARRLGYEPAGCIYDVLAKPGIRPLKATPVESRKYTKAGALYANQRDHDETPDEYLARCVETIAEAPDRFYSRIIVVRLDAELAEYARDAWDLGRMIRDDELAGRAPKNPESCRRFNARCPYFAVCCGEASLDDPTRFRKVERLHPELSPVGSTAKEEPYHANQSERPNG